MPENEGFEFINEEAAGTPEMEEPVFEEPTIEEPDYDSDMFGGEPVFMDEPMIEEPTVDGPEMEEPEEPFMEEPPYEPEINGMVPEIEEPEMEDSNISAPDMTEPPEPMIEDTNIPTDAVRDAAPEDSSDDKGTDDKKSDGQITDEVEQSAPENKDDEYGLEDETLEPGYEKVDVNADGFGQKVIEYMKAMGISEEEVLEDIRDAEMKVRLDAFKAKNLDQKFKDLNADVYDWNDDVDQGKLDEMKKVTLTEKLTQAGYFKDAISKTNTVLMNMFKQKPSLSSMLKAAEKLKTKDKSKTKTRTKTRSRSKLIDSDERER